ncbi:REF/SRPP-like protein At1g67360 [Ziziphus jujuba]|uniref:REF/SRPP-like protein At1g67360 n=2 Tax=Ziziphus jujuba TaxID=326968 RepID=A0A6P3Z601_ZIZJJ|nr:REF/SRPP-like protein At1g67360 [Ziziphus jujuba]
MASSNKMETESRNQELKHLGFVRVAAIQALVCMSNLYDYAKQNSGPLRSVVGTVEGAVTTVVGPVYEKFKDVPDDFLSFADKKVDEATYKFDKHAPPLAKQVVSRAHCYMVKASEKARKFVNVAQTGGPRAAIHCAATEYKQLVLNQAVRLWVGVNQCPPVHTVAQKAAPTAAQLSEKYNRTVKDLTTRGYTVFGYFPLVPIDEIAKAFKQGESETGKKMDSDASSGDKSDSDSD